MSKYAIYQLNHDLGKHIRDYSFRSYGDVVGEGLTIDKGNYECVYEFESEDCLTKDDIYYIFNMMRPKDFRGHSLSVSDVIMVPDGYYYCDSFGWRKLDWRDE